MTSSAHPRRLLRRRLRASRKRSPARCEGGFWHRFCAWDAMGYHGITWASMNHPSTSPCPGRPDLNRSLTGCRLKDWLRPRFHGGERAALSGVVQGQDEEASSSPIEPFGGADKSSIDP